MDFWQTFTDVNFWMTAIREFQNFGPLGPILLAASESLFSFLPFIAIVAFHVGIYGELLGFVYSWIGTALGSAAVFLMFRFCSCHLLFLHDLHAMKHLRAFMSHQDRCDLFMMTACAFMPSFLINVAYGFSEFDKGVYLRTIIFSKAVMTATLVMFGATIRKAMEEPLFLFLSLFIFFGLYAVSKRIKEKLHLREKTK